MKGRGTMMLPRASQVFGLAGGILAAFAFAGCAAQADPASAPPQSAPETPSIPAEPLTTALRGAVGGEWVAYDDNKREPGVIRGVVDLPERNKRGMANVIYLICPWPGDREGRDKAKAMIFDWMRPMDVVWSNERWTLLGDGLGAQKEPDVAAITGKVVAILETRK